MNIINIFNSTSQLTFTLISGIFISAVAGYLGTLMLSKKMSVVAGPIAHLALPGVALAIIFNFSIFLGAFPFVILGAILIWFLERRTRLPMENLTAIIFVFTVGVALLILPIEKAEEALIGSITTITPWETLVTVILSFGVFFVVRKIYDKMMLVNMDEELAVAEGINVGLYNLIYLLNIGIVVALGVYLVGGIITVALIAVPAASAKNISRGINSYKITAVTFGVSSAFLGIVIAEFFNLPAGPMVVICGVAMFLISIIFRKKYY